MESANPRPPLIRFLDRIFWGSVIGFLLVAAIAKLASSFLDLPVQAEIDPLLGVTQRILWRAGAVMDLVFVVLLWRLRVWRNSLGIWMALLFLSYHGIRAVLQLPPRCPCLGSASLWTGLDEAELGKISAGFSLYLLFGAGCFFLSGWSRVKPFAEPREGAGRASSSKLPVVGFMVLVAVLGAGWLAVTRPQKGAVKLAPVAKAFGANKPSIVVEYVGQVPLMPGRDVAGIAALNNPGFVSAGIAAGWLKKDAMIVGISDGPHSKAYPVGIFNRHEIVNDRLGSNEVVVTWCPLAATAAAHLRRVNGKLLRFSVAEVLFESTLVMADAETGSLWYQPRGEALKGRLKGRLLNPIPTVLCSWNYWRAQHPETEVLSYLTGYTNHYATNYWQDIGGMNAVLNSPPSFPVTYLDASRPPKEVVLGLDLGRRQIAFPVADLLKGDARLEVNGKKLLVTYDEVARAPLAFYENGGQREPAGAMHSYWYAWKAAWHESEVWNPPTNLPAPGR